MAVMNLTDMDRVNEVGMQNYSIMDKFEAITLITKENYNVVKELENTILDLRDREQSIKEQEVKFNYELTELEEQLKNMRKEADTLKERSKTLEIEIMKLNSECKISERHKQPSSTDKRILQKHKMKLKLYKNLIGLKWDYTTPEEQCVGYVFNSSTNEVKPFSFEDANSSTEKIWSEVKAVASPDWENIE